MSKSDGERRCLTFKKVICLCTAAVENRVTMTAYSGNGQCSSELHGAIINDSDVASERRPCNVSSIPQFCNCKWFEHYWTNTVAFTLNTMPYHGINGSITPPQKVCIN